MPLQEQTVLVPLLGLDQKSDQLGRPLGALDRAINARFDKTVEGVRIDKRLGYQFVDVANVVNRFDTDEILTHVTAWGSELVLFTYDYVVALGDRNALLRGLDALVYRGPCNRGTCRVHFDAQSRLGSDT
jgi:hypothetical protein